jgi:ABC-type amino acid transport substrate-binding protein
MKFGQILLVVILSFAVAFATVSFKSGSKGGATAPTIKETRWEQIKRTGVLRCGYQTWPPFLTKDPNTGKMSGLEYDLTEEMGRQLSLKIEWVGEVSTGNMLADLSMNRYDAICSLFGTMPSRLRGASFMKPFFYLPVYMFVRSDDTRFDNDLGLANQPDVKFAILDGEYSAISAEANYPAAAKVAIPQLSTISELFVMVASKKADALLEDVFTFDEYNKSNPGIIRPAGNKLVAVIPCTFPIPSNEPDLKDALDTALSYLQSSGFVEQLFKKYEGERKFLRATKAYVE